MMGLVLLAALVPIEESLAAELKNIRVKAQPEKTEIVLDLKGQPADFVVNKEEPGQITVRFSGRIDPAMKTRSQSLSGHMNLRSMYWEESKDGKVQLFIKRQAPSDINVYPLENPDRLVVRVDENYEFSRTTAVAPGVLHRHIAMSSAKGPLNIHVLEIDPQNPEIVIEPVLASSSLHGKAKVSRMVNNNRGIAGINAAFFKPDSGTNLGTVILNRELVAGPIYNRVSLGITTDKKFKMDRITLKGSLFLPNSRVTIPIHTVNQPRTEEDQHVLYTSRWGNMAPPIPKGGIQIQMSGNRILAVASDRSLSIPPEGYVLVCPISGLSNIPRAGEEIGLQVYTIPDWVDVEHAISGGPYLVKEGQVFVDAKEQSFRDGSFMKAAPRTAVGITPDNRLLMVTVDGRQQDLSVGVTLYEMAQIMKALGATDAMNLDGGSSTQMVVRGSVVNSPSVAGGASVSSSLIVRQVPSSIQTEIIGTTADEPIYSHFQTQIP